MKGKPGSATLSAGPDGEAADSFLYPMHFPIFRNVWLASMVSNLGILIQSVGAAWLMVSISGSPDMVAWVQASVALPILTLSLPAGAFADSFDRRHLMIVAQVLALLVSIALAAFSWLDLITPWRLLFFTFLVGCGTALYAPAWQASIGDMVPRTVVPAAVALNSLGYNLARSIGPALGGIIVATWSASAAFSINAVAYIGLIVVLARWKLARVDNPLPREGFVGAVGTGIRYAAMSPAIGAVLGRGLLFGCSASAIMSLMPLLARDVVRGGPVTYGFLLGGYGVGAIVGAISMARLRRLISSEAIIQISCWATAVAALLAGVSSFLPAALAMMFLAGAAYVLAMSTFNVTVQLRSPRWVVARTLSLYQMATFGGMTLGSWLWGVVTKHDGLIVALACAAAVIAICALIGSRLPLAPVARLDLNPLRDWHAPICDLPIGGRSGPVAIAIDYRIAPADRPHLLAAMAEQRRMRRRDGARNWVLAQDLAVDGLWTERFRLPTWQDYVRFENRLTKDDAPTQDRLRALHCGSAPPIVRQMLEIEPARRRQGENDGGK